MSNSSKIEHNIFYRYIGNGLFPGILAAGLSHLIFKEPSGIIMILVFRLSLYRKHGWMEYCALYSMMGAFVTYFAIYESFKLGAGFLVSLGLSVLIVVMYFVFAQQVVGWTVRVRARILARKHGISAEEAMVLPLKEQRTGLNRGLQLCRLR